MGFAPYDVKLKLTFRCNAQCYYCLHHLKTKTIPNKLADQELSKFEWTKLIKELASLGSQSFHFTGGEPTLRSDLPELVRLVGKKLKLRAKMTSNGSLITPNLAEQLAQAKLKTINISLDGFGSMHDKVRGKGMFDKTWAGIQALDEARQKFGRPQVRINHVITSENIRHLGEFLTFLDQEGRSISAIHLLFVDWGHTRHDLALAKEEVGELLRQFSNLQSHTKLDIREASLLLEQADTTAEDFSRGSYATKALTLPCYFPYVHLFILPNGDLNICCGAERRPELSLGNLRKQSAKELWEGPSYLRLREFLHTEKFDFCKACDHGILINETIEAKLNGRSECTQ